jgi:hypothetical protein
MPRTDQLKPRKCPQRKLRHNTEEQARAAMNALLRRRDKQGNPIVAVMKVYGCSCGGFHVGSSRGINWDKVAELTPTTK